MDPQFTRRERLIALVPGRWTSQCARKRMTELSERIMLSRGDYSKMEVISLRNNMMLLMLSKVLLNRGFREQTRNFQDLVATGTICYLHSILLLLQDQRDLHFQSQGAKIDCRILARNSIHKRMVEFSLAHWTITKVLGWFLSIVCTKSQRMNPMKRMDKILRKVWRTLLKNRKSLHPWKSNQQKNLYPRLLQ